MSTSILKGPQLFLIDALGAFVSGLSLLIPYTFDAFFGMPQKVILRFIIIAILYFIYSTTVYLIQPKNWKTFLLFIALMNIGYCLYTAYHLLQHMETVTVFGYLYFIGEVLIILTLSVVEFKLSRTKTIS